MGTSIDLGLEMCDVGLKIGCLVVLLGIGSHAHAEVGGYAVFYIGVEILSTVESRNHGHQLIAVGKAIRLGLKKLLSRHGIAAQGHHIVDTHEVEVEQLAFDLGFRGPAAYHMRHHLDIEAAHDGRRDGQCAGALGQGQARVGAIAVVDIFHLVAVTGDVDKRRGKLHERFNGRIEAHRIVALEGRHYLERGKGLVAAVDDVDNLGHCTLLINNFSTSSTGSRRRRA